VAENRVGCDRTGRVCRPESGFREGTGTRGTWLIDVTELDEAKEGAVTKVDFAMAPPRIAPSDYRDGNELTTKAGSRRHDAGHYPWQILRYDVDFFFPSAPFSTYPLFTPRPPSSYHSASVEATPGCENEFLLGNGLLCGTEALSPAISATRISCQSQNCRPSFLMVYLRNEGFTWNGLSPSNKQHCQLINKCLSFLRIFPTCLRVSGQLYSYDNKSLKCVKCEKIAFYHYLNWNNGFRESFTNKVVGNHVVVRNSSFPTRIISTKCNFSSRCFQFCENSCKVMQIDRCCEINCYRKTINTFF